jgi:hypothetical protein
MKKRVSSILVIIGFLFLSSGVFGQRQPLETVRSPQSFISGLYFPSFNPDSVVPLHDNFSINGSFVNLIPRGNNLNFFYGLTHNISAYPVLPHDTTEIDEVIDNIQCRDTIYGRLSFAFGRWYLINSQIDFLQNKVIVDSDKFSDYNYNLLSYSMDFTIDTRYSSRQNWYKGMVFIYPEKGFKASLGASINKMTYTSSKQVLENPYFFKVFSDLQYLIQLSDFWVLAFGASGETHLEPLNKRSQLLTTKIIGAFDIPGDYWGDWFAELRFLHGRGLYIDTPPFWIIGSFQFKFTPGFLVGYNGGISGFLDTPDNSFVHSIYVSPLVAILMNADLLGVLRFDIAFASSQNYSFVLSFNIGGSVDDKPAPMFKTGVK